MTHFLEKFKGRSTRVGKEGILQILQREFTPIPLNLPAKPKHKRSPKAKSIELHQISPDKDRVELPPIRFNLKQKSKLSSPSDGKASMSSHRSASRVSELIKQKQQELMQGMKQGPAKHKKSSIIGSRSGRGSSFENVPDEFQSFEIPKDEMRFLKSFERYTNTRHFTIHRKMSKRDQDPE